MRIEFFIYFYSSKGKIKKDIQKCTHKRNEIEYTFENINIQYATYLWNTYIGIDGGFDMFLYTSPLTVLHLFKEFNSV